MQVDDIFQTYTDLRGNGIAAREALQRVRPMIDPLTREDRVKLTDNIRGFEAGDGQPQSPKKTTRTIKSLRDTKPKLERVFCDSCGKPNRKGEIICVHCGKLLGNAKPTASTRQLKTINTDTQQPEYFGTSSELLLHIQHSDEVLHLRPQSYDHEVVVGRADAKKIVIPDVDLTEYGATRLGVSRLHLGITYNQERKQLTVSDIGSANGVYVNGQKLAKNEVRILRDGDQVHLGEFVASVTFRHEN